MDGGEPGDEPENRSEDDLEDQGGTKAGDEDPQLEIKILTATGQDVRTIEGPATPGAHEVLWDFRMDPAYEPQGNRGGGGGGGADSLGARGPTVLPSVYQIRMDVGRTTMLGDLTVRQDPRIDVPRADLAARQAAMMSMYQLRASVYRARQAVQRLNLQLSDVEQFLRETAATESFGYQLEGIMEELDDVDRGLRRLLIRTGEEGRARPVSTARQIEASTTRPTEDQLQDVERAWRDSPEVFERLNALILARIPAFYQRLNNDAIRADPGEHLVVPRRRGR